MKKQSMPPSRNAAAVVTGAGSGIGRSFAYELARRGGSVICADINAERAEQIAASLQSLGSTAIARHCDVGDAEQMKSLSDEAEQLLGRPVTLVINNAGVGLGGPIGEVSLEDWQWCMNVNLWGVIHGIRAFVPILLEQDEPGHVVNTCSMAGLINMPFSGAYNVSKHAALSLSETLYHELRLRQSPVGCSALCPELIRTSIGRSDRNRPPHLKRPEEGLTSEATLAENAIREIIDRGLDPSVMAERVVTGIREDRFYLLAEPGSEWETACHQRLDDIRERRNPTVGVITGDA